MFCGHSCWQYQIIAAAKVILFLKKKIFLFIIIIILHAYILGYFGFALTAIFFFLHKQQPYCNIINNICF